MDRPHKDTAYYEAFKRVRNRLRKYDAGEIVLDCITRLHTTDANSAKDFRGQLPWMLFLLIKWAVVFGEFTSHGKRSLGTKDGDDLIGLMHAVGNSVVLPSEISNPLLLLRSVAYQQFWHQLDASLAHIARQACFFDGLEPTHTFRRWFKQDTGLDVGDFIELAFMLHAYMSKWNMPFLTESFCRPVEKSFPPNSVTTFFRALSRTPDELKRYLTSLEEETQRSSSEYNERTPLTRWPLLRLGDRYYFYSRRMLMHALGTYVYDALRRHNSEMFMNRFGEMFEKYIRMGVESCRAQALDETSISKLIGRPSKAVDFLIREAEGNVLIDAKGVEVGHLGMTSYRPDVVTERVKTSVVKGIAQAVQTIRAIAGVADRLQINPDRSRNYLLIVTYKDLYLGTGQDFYECFAFDRLQSVLGERPERSPIPLNHIYVISVEEFDHLVSCLINRGGTFSEVLKKAVAHDSRWETKVLQLKQHLENWYGEIEFPVHVKKTVDELLKRAAKRFGEGGSEMGSGLNKPNGHRASSA